MAVVGLTEQIREVINTYVKGVEAGATDDLVGLYAANATVEDPVGSDPRHGAEEIRAFYQILEPIEKKTELRTVRIAANQAAFEFELVTKVGDQQFALAVIDVMEFDDEGKIVSMKAYWGQDDLKQL